MDNPTSALKFDFTKEGETCGHCGGMHYGSGLTCPYRKPSSPPPSGLQVWLVSEGDAPPQYVPAAGEELETERRFAQLYRSALIPCYEVLAALHLSAQWELAPAVKAKIAEAVTMAEKAFSTKQIPLESNSVAPSARPAERRKGERRAHAPQILSGSGAVKNPHFRRSGDERRSTAAPSRTGGEEKMPNERKVACENAGGTLNIHAESTTCEVCKPSAPASAARREDFRNWYSRLPDKAYLVKSEFVDQIRREDFDTGATWTTIERALRFAEHWAAEQTRQLREELAMLRRSADACHLAASTESARASNAEQRAQAAEAERDKLLEAAKAFMQELDRLRKACGHTSVTDCD